MSLLHSEANPVSSGACSSACGPRYSPHQEEMAIRKPDFFEGNSCKNSSNSLAAFLGLCKSVWFSVRKQLSLSTYLPPGSKIISKEVDR